MHKDHALSHFRTKEKVTVTAQHTTVEERKGEARVVSGSEHKPVAWAGVR